MTQTSSKTPQHASPSSSDGDRVILHLSDLHFGYDKDKDGEVAQEKNLRKLIDVVAALDTGWKPSIVCVTGDIGWRGIESDYDKAKEWFDLLLEKIGIGYDQVVMCPGNHDVVRDVAKQLRRPDSAAHADELLSMPLSEVRKMAFGPFTSFCESAGIQQVQCGETFSHLFGIREVSGIRFVVCNTAWCSRDDNDKANLWIGLPLLEILHKKHGFVEQRPQTLEKHDPSYHREANKLGLRASLLLRGGFPSAKRSLLRTEALVLGGPGRRTSPLLLKRDRPVVQLRRADLRRRDGAHHRARSGPSRVVHRPRGEGRRRDVAVFSLPERNARRSGQSDAQERLVVRRGRGRPTLRHVGSRVSRIPRRLPRDRSADSRVVQKRCLLRRVLSDRFRHVGCAQGFAGDWIWRHPR